MFEGQRKNKLNRCAGSFVTLANASESYRSSLGDVVDVVEPGRVDPSDFPVLTGVNAV